MHHHPTLDLAPPPRSPHSPGSPTPPQPCLCCSDIKPQNLLVNINTHALKLCDFGSAKTLVRGEPNISYICSRYYRAPELIFGATDYTCAIDVRAWLVPGWVLVAWCGCVVEGIWLMGLTAAVVCVRHRCAWLMTGCQQQKSGLWKVATDVQHSSLQTSGSWALAAAAC